MSNTNSQQVTGEKGADDRRKPWVRRSHLAVLLMVSLLVALAIVIVTIIPTLVRQDDGTGAALPSEVTLTLWLVIGVVVLMIVIMAAALLSNFIIGKRGTPTALGLPEGSVSAIIALLLLMIFAISSVYLFSQIRGGEGDGFESRGLTAEAIGSLPQDRILATTVENPAETNAALRTYTVRLAATHSDSVEFAKTSAQTIGTLLAAVAGFYFGQRATQSGAHIVEGTSGQNRSDGAGPAPDPAVVATTASAAAMVIAEREKREGDAISKPAKGPKGRFFSG